MPLRGTIGHTAFALHRGFALLQCAKGQGPAYLDMRSTEIKKSTSTQPHRGVSQHQIESLGSRADPVEEGQVVGEAWTKHHICRQMCLQHPEERRYLPHAGSGKAHPV